MLYRTYLPSDYEVVSLWITVLKLLPYNLGHNVFDTLVNRIIKLHISGINKVLVVKLTYSSLENSPDIDHFIFRFDKSEQLASILGQQFRLFCKLVDEFQNGYQGSFVVILNRRKYLYP